MAQQLNHTLRYQRSFVISGQRRRHSGADA